MHSIRVLAFFSSVCVAVVLCFAPISSAQEKEPLRTAAARPVDMLHIKLELDVQLKKKSVSGRATLDFAALSPIQTLTLDAVSHEIQNVQAKTSAGPIKVSWTNSGQQISINFERQLKRGEKVQVAIDYRVREPKAGLHFFQPSKEDPDVPLTVWSQGEPIANRHWFPCLDNPNERQTTEIIATVDAGFECLSNGSLQSKKVLKNKRVQFHWKQAKPHVAYLVTLVVGEFVVGRDEWRGRPVTYYVPKSRAKDMAKTFKNTTKMLDFFSEKFGIEYPWEKYAQVVVEQFIMGGMENTSATSLYGRVMHDERALLDGTPDWLIAHELGHQWWGDLVTCKDWSHLWLNEGFATYCEIMWAEHYSGIDEAHYRLIDKSRSARSGAALTRPIVDRRYAKPSAMFDSRAYPKGGWVLHMLRSQLGDEDFYRGLQRYGTVYAYQTAETSDLRQVFEKLYGVSLERFFHDWTERPAHPELLVKSTYLPKEGLMRLDVKQTQKVDPFQIPLTIDLVIDGEKEPVRFSRLMTDREFKAFVPVKKRPSQIRVDPEYTLLAAIKEQKANDWWEAQLFKAGGIAERIRAIEHLSAAKTDKNRELIAQSLSSDAFYGVRIEAAKALAKMKGNIARDALVKAINQPNAKVRNVCIGSLAQFKNDKAVITALKKKLAAGDESYKAEAATISSLSRVGEKPPVDLLIKSLDKPSHGEVIQLAALRSLATSKEPKVLDVLMDWTKRGKPLRCRTEACRYVAQFAVANEIDKKKTALINNHFQELLKTEGPRLRRYVAQALGQLGPLGDASVDFLRKVAQEDADGRVKTDATKAINKIRTANPAAVELARLRKEIQEARKKNVTLEERLEKLESK
jgi:aminopeptidase N